MEVNVWALVVWQAALLLVLLVPLLAPLPVLLLVPGFLVAAAPLEEVVSECLSVLLLLLGLLPAHVPSARLPCARKLLPWSTALMPADHAAG